MSRMQLLVSYQGSAGVQIVRGGRKQTKMAYFFFSSSLVLTSHVSCGQSVATAVASARLDVTQAVQYLMLNLLDIRHSDTEPSAPLVH